jgi:hypothetical protein
VTPVFENGIVQLFFGTSKVVDNRFKIFSTVPCEFNWVVYGKRHNIDVEVDKDKSIIKGDGPYKWLD